MTTQGMRPEEINHGLRFYVGHRCGVVEIYIAVGSCVVNYGGQIDCRGGSGEGGQVFAESLERFGVAPRNDRSLVRQSKRHTLGEEWSVQFEDEAHRGARILPFG